MAPLCSSLVWGHPSCKAHAGMPHHLDFFKMWCPQQQKTCFTKRAATAQKFKIGHWGQQTGPLKSDEQVRGGKKNHLTPVCNFSKIPAAKKNGDYKGVAATQLFFSWCKCPPRAPISHTHGHAKGFGQLQAVCGSGIFTADVQKCTPRAPQSRLAVWVLPVFGVNCIRLDSL